MGLKILIYTGLLSLIKLCGHFGEKLLKNISIVKVAYSGLDHSKHVHIVKNLLVWTYLCWYTGAQLVQQLEDITQVRCKGNCLGAMFILQ